MALKAGTFTVKGVRGALGYTNTGKEQVGVELCVVDDGEFFGERITWYGYFTEKTFDRTIESLRILGWDGDDLSDLTGLDRNEAQAVIEEDEYDGKLRLKVQWINAKGGLAIQKPMGDSEAASFAQRMKGRVLSHRQKNGGAVAQTASTRSGARGRDDVPPPPSDDDIPF